MSMVLGEAICMNRLTIEDVITNCELYYELHGCVPSCIKEAAQRMLDDGQTTKDHHVEMLLNNIIGSSNPRIYLTAAKAKLQYIESAVYVEESA